MNTLVVYLTSISGIQCGCHGDCHLPQLTGSTIFMQIECIAQGIQFWWIQYQEWGLSVVSVSFFCGSKGNNFHEKEQLCLKFVAAASTIYQEPHFWTRVRIEGPGTPVLTPKILASESIATHDLIQQKEFNSWNLWIKTACNLIG